MSEQNKEGEDFYLPELPLVIQENKVKSAIISIDHLKKLLTRIGQLEREVMFYREIFMENLNCPFVKEKKSRKEEFVSWEEMGFTNLGIYKEDE